MAKDEKIEDNKKETTSLIIGIIACVFSFLGVLILPLSIVGLVKSVKCSGNSGTKVAAIIFNILSILLSIISTIFIVILIGAFNLAFTTVDKTIDKAKDFVEEYDYDYDNDYGDYGTDKGYKNDGSRKLIGNSNFGYLEVSDTWNFGVREGKDFIVYYSKDNDDEIMLDIITNSENLEDAYSDLLVPILKNGNPTKIEEITINNKYKGYSIEKTGLDEEKNETIYLFQTEDNVIRTIRISSFDYDSEIFDVYDTYYLKKNDLVS